MQFTAPRPSIEAIGDRIGPLIERHIDRVFRRIHAECVEHDPRFFRAITGAPHPFANFALVSDPGDVDAARDAVAPLCACGAPAAALFVGAVAPEVDGALRESGFEPHGNMPAMGIDIDRLAPSPSPKGCSLVRLRPGEREDDWIDAFAAGYEIPRAAASLFSPGAMGAGEGDDAPMQFFAAVNDGEIVATSMLALDDGVAGIYAVSTLPAQRGKGLGALATAEPLRIAHRLGYRVGVLQSSEAGHAVYKRLGFADFGGVPLYVRAPSR